MTSTATDIVLSHFTEQPLTLDRYMRYEQPAPNMKPRGLWLSDESNLGWKYWCESEDFRLEKLEHRTDFRIAEGSNVLHLDTEDAVRGFGATWRAEDAEPVLRHWIDWGRVAQAYDGILITPYQWEVRYDLDHMWYSGWDVASACIWNLGALERVYPTREAV